MPSNAVVVNHTMYWEVPDSKMKPIMELLERDGEPLEMRAESRLSLGELLALANRCHVVALAFDEDETGTDSPGTDSWVRALFQLEDAADRLAAMLHRARKNSIEEVGMIPDL